MGLSQIRIVCNIINIGGVIDSNKYFLQDSEFGHGFM